VIGITDNAQNRNRNGNRIIHLLLFLFLFRFMLLCVPADKQKKMRTDAEFAKWKKFSFRLSSSRGEHGVCASFCLRNQE